VCVRVCACMRVCMIGFFRGSLADTAGSRTTILTMSHSLKSTPTDGRRFTALGLTLAVTHPSSLLTEVDVL
jgi:hypothetical protein